MDTPAESRFDEETIRITLEKLDAYFVAKKKLEFFEAMTRLEDTSDRLAREGRIAELPQSPEYLVIKAYVDQTAEEFSDELRRARIGNANNVFDTLMVRRVVAYLESRRAQSATKRAMSAAKRAKTTV